MFNYQPISLTHIFHGTFKQHVIERISQQHKKMEPRDLGCQLLTRSIILLLNVPVEHAELPLSYFCSVQPQLYCYNDLGKQDLIAPGYNYYTMHVNRQLGCVDSLQPYHSIYTLYLITGMRIILGPVKLATLSSDVQVMCAHRPHVLARYLCLENILFGIWPRSVNSNF